MRTGLVRQALRRHRSSLLAPAATQVLAAAVISSMVMTAWSLGPSQLSAADRAVVVASEMDDVTSVFLGSAIYLAILIVGVTVNLAIQQQLEDIALVRVIGATPGRVRRAVALQVAVATVPASALGWLLAVPATAWWMGLLRQHDVLPAGARLQPQLLALPITVAILLPTAVVGALVAAMRTSRIAPSAALTEAWTRRRPIGRLRVVVGATLMLGGVILSLVVSQLDPKSADDSAFFVMLAECIGVGMLAPVALRHVAAAVRRFARDGMPRLAADSIEVMSRSLAGALVPLVLATAFTLLKIGVHTTTSHVTGDGGPPADAWTDYSGTVIYAVFAAVAAVNCLVTVVEDRRRDLAAMRLLGGDRRTLLGVTVVEALIVAATAAVLSAVIACVTLAPTLHSALGRWLPYFPPLVPIAGLVLLTGLVVATMGLTAVTVTRVAPTEIIAEAP